MFLELAAGKYGGASVRWCIIVCVHLAKAGLRLMMLIKYRSGIVSSPPIPPLKRNRDLQEYMESIQTPTDEEQNAEEMFDSEETKVKRENIDADDDSSIFTLRRSGRVIRSLKATPPMTLRSWQLPPGKAAHSRDNSIVIVPEPTRLNELRRLGELLHAVRPLIHLLSLYQFGEQSLKPWLVACGVDVSSLCLMGDPADLNRRERAELKRRTYLMLLYMLRSPFYDRFSQSKLFLAIHILSSNIPGAQLLMNPLEQYLKYWQQIYFYVWRS